MTPLDYAAQICYSSKEVLKFSYESAIKYKNIEGCIIEAGVAAGAQIIAFAYADPDKKIYAMDSYDGLPWPSNKDDQLPGIRFLQKWEQASLPDPGMALLETTGATRVTLDDFKEHITRSGVESKNIIPVKGWFENVLPTFECEPINILRLDSDLYYSTYVCLKYLYPKVIEGGLIIIDDIQLPGCRDAVTDYFRSIPHFPRRFSYVDNVAYFKKRSTW